MDCCRQRSGLVWQRQQQQHSLLHAASRREITRSGGTTGMMLTVILQLESKLSTAVKAEGQRRLFTDFSSPLWGLTVHRLLPGWQALWQRQLRQTQSAPTPRTGCVQSMHFIGSRRQPPIQHTLCADKSHMGVIHTRSTPQPTARLANPRPTVQGARRCAAQTPPPNPLVCT